MYLNYQKYSGSLIIKLPHIYNKITIQLIHILSIYYDINIYKGINQSCFIEKCYLICTNFRGITDNDFDKLLTINNLLNNSFF